MPQQSSPRLQTQGSAMGLHGGMYQSKLFTLFLYRAISREYSFRLGTEIEEAHKFDDLVFEYTIDGRKEYRLIQAKHKFDENKKITSDQLLAGNDGDFSLIKYYFSYINLKEEPLFKDHSIKDVTICTNIGFDFANLDRAKIEVIEIHNQDDILDMKLNNNSEKQPRRYKFSKSIIPALKNKLQNYNLTKLANKLAQCFLKNIVIAYDESIFKSYHYALAKEVINVKDKNFHDKFIKNDDSLSKSAKTFRKLFTNELKKISKSTFNHLDTINDAISSKKKIIANTQVGLNISSEFGKENKTKKSTVNSTHQMEIGDLWSNNTISDTIEDFIDHLVFAVDQPNQEELDVIISKEIGEEFSFDYISIENIYNNFLKTNLDWLLSKQRERFLSYTEGKEFLEKAISAKPCLFDVREPIYSFTGRAEELENLHKILQSEGTASISGLGGIGKSELARKYVYKYSQSYDNNIIWVNAENYSSLGESFRRLARDKLRICMINSEGIEKDMKSIVEDVYRSFAKRKCLFIFDNAEKRRSQKEFDEGIEHFLPNLPTNMIKSYVLITSRNREWGNIQGLSLNVFTETEAIEFIRKVLNREDQSQEQEIRDLVTLLQCFPLALQQAVAFIKANDEAYKNNNKKFDINDYINLFRDETKKLLDFKFPSGSSDSYTKTTLTTWKITFDKIKEDQEYGPEAEKILELMSYLDPKNISGSLFLVSVTESDDILAHAIQLLRHYSIIDRGHENGLLNIHRLVQEVIRIYLKDQKREEDILGKVYTLLEDKFPYEKEEIGDYAKKQQLLPHLEMYWSHVLKWEPSDKSLKMQKIVKLYKLISDALSGHPNREIIFLKSAKDLIKAYYGPDSLELVNILLRLAELYSALGEPREEMEMLQQVHPILQKNCDDSYAMLLFSQTGNCFIESGDIQTGKAILHSVLRQEEIAYGPYHINLTKTLICLCRAYIYTYEYRTAEEFFTRALLINDKTYGSEHISIAEILMHVGCSIGNPTYNWQKYKIELVEGALQIFKKHYGFGHYNVTAAVISLGICYKELKDYHKSKELLEGALLNHDYLYGFSHHQVGLFKQELAFVYGMLGDLNKQKEMIHEVVCIFEKYSCSCYVPVLNYLKHCKQFEEYEIRKYFDGIDNTKCADCSERHEKFLDTDKVNIIKNFKKSLSRSLAGYKIHFDKHSNQEKKCITEILVTDIKKILSPNECTI